MNWLRRDRKESTPSDRIHIVACKFETMLEIKTCIKQRRATKMPVRLTLITRHGINYLTRRPRSIYHRAAYPPRRGHDAGDCALAAERQAPAEGTNSTALMLNLLDCGALAISFPSLQLRFSLSRRFSLSCRGPRLRPSFWWRVSLSDLHSFSYLRSSLSASLLSSRSRQRAM